MSIQLVNGLGESTAPFVLASLFLFAVLVLLKRLDDLETKAKLKRPVRVDDGTPFEITWDADTVVLDIPNRS